MVKKSADRGKRLIGGYVFLSTANWLSIEISTGIGDDERDTRGILVVWELIREKKTGLDPNRPAHMSAIGICDGAAFLVAL
jgi:hypothetical protein